MTTSMPFALYDAFTEFAFGGSQAGVVSNATQLDTKTRQKIAQEIGAPATAFITAIDENAIAARFHSPQTEYNMCGHGTICLMTRLIEQNKLCWGIEGSIDIDLQVADSTAPVQIIRREDGRPEVLLDITPPDLSRQALDQNRLARLLGLHADDIATDWPIDKAVGDFIHLIVPLENLETISRVAPDFSGLVEFCHQYGLQTIMVFCTETEGPEIDVHMRDFCPAVGVAESAGAGTSNAALTSYLLHHNIINPRDESEPLIIQAEQGIELQRPSLIRSFVTINSGSIARLQVGGVATKIIEGELKLPDTGMDK